MQQLEDERLQTTLQLASKKEESLTFSRDIAQAQEKIVDLEAKLASKETELVVAKDATMLLEVEKELRARCEVREEAERRERIAACSQLMAIQSECTRTLADIEAKKSLEIAALQDTIKNTTEQRDNSMEEARRLSDQTMGLEKEIEQLHLALENASANHEAVEQLGRATREIEVLRLRLKEANEMQQLQGSLDASRIAEYEEKLRQGEVQRRKLHNLVQELRGNVRVFARVRPYLPNDGVDMSNPPEPTITAKVDANSMRIARSPRGPDDRAEEHLFTFDKVFGPSTSQETVFDEVSEFVQSALDGYAVCLFSYGQTGSGKVCIVIFEASFCFFKPSLTFLKTHTMQGCGNGSMRGIIPRAMQQVGQYKRELECKGWEYHMEVSFIEIYNESVRDLLRVSGSSEELKHEIKKDAQNGVYITDVTMLEVDPNDNEQVDSIIETAARNRSVGTTAMNERSSRSHSVFALHLRATNPSQGIVLKGTLSLVDLAGSERLDRSLATGAQMKETVAINKSLSALTDVFVAIGNKQTHIPFRNSKLTYLLQPALSGDGKTLMVSKGL